MSFTEKSPSTTPLVKSDSSSSRASSDSELKALLLLTIQGEAEQEKLLENDKPLPKRPDTVATYIVQKVAIDSPSTVSWSPEVAHFKVPKVARDKVYATTALTIDVDKDLTCSPSKDTTLVDKKATKTLKATSVETSTRTGTPTNVKALTQACAKGPSESLGAKKIIIMVKDTVSPRSESVPAQPQTSDLIPCCGTDSAKGAFSDRVSTVDTATTAGPEPKTEPEVAPLPLDIKTFTPEQSVSDNVPDDDTLSLRQWEETSDATIPAPDSNAPSVPLIMKRSVRFSISSCDTTLSGGSDDESSLKEAPTALEKIETAPSPEIENLFLTREAVGTMLAGISTAKNAREQIKDQMGEILFIKTRQILPIQWACALLTAVLALLLYMHLDSIEPILHRAAGIM